MAAGAAVAFMILFSVMGTYNGEIREDKVQVKKIAVEQPLTTVTTPELRCVSDEKGVMNCVSKTQRCKFIDNELFCKSVDDTKL